MQHAANSGLGELPEGTLIGGRYRLGPLLGRGGMGAVYEATHVELERPVAIKTLLPQATGNATVSRRLIHEARAAARIGHPGIVDVFDLLEQDGVTFVVMERLRGEELHARIARAGQLPVGFVVRMGIEVAEAIAAAHGRGIVHRDLKPRNIFVATHPRLGEVFKVLDFGIAKLAQDADPTLDTHSGHVLGTPAYMAPERLAGAPTDERVDVYAIGAVMYEALTGRTPFQASSYAELVLRISSEAPPPIGESRPDAAGSLARVIERSLAKDPRARQPSARALAAELTALQASLAADSGVHPTLPASATTAPRVVGGRHRPPGSPATKRRRRRRLARTALALAAGAAIGVALWTAAQPHAPPGARRARAAAPVARAGAEPELPSMSPSTSTSTSTSTTSTASPGPEPRPRSIREVQVESAPPGAAIWVDGRRECEAPCALRLTDGEHAVKATLSGYRPVRRTLRPPLPERMKLLLTRSPRKPRSHQPRPDPETLPPLLPR